MSRLPTISAACLVMMTGLANAQSYPSSAGSGGKVGFAMAGAHTNQQADCSLSLHAHGDGELSWYEDDRVLEFDDQFQLRFEMKSIGKVVIAMEDALLQNYNDTLIYMGDPTEVTFRLSTGRPVFPRIPWVIDSTNLNELASITLSHKYTGNVYFVMRDLQFHVPDGYVDDPHATTTAILTATCYSD